MTSLTNLLAAQMTGYFTFDNNFDFNSLKKINYITAANGTFRVEKTATAIFKVKISENKKPIPGLNVMEEGVELLIPKIPFKFLQQALSFYTDVYDKDQTEASLLFFWNGENKAIARKYSDGTDVKGLFVEGQLVIYVPRQKNNGTLSEFHADPMVDWLRNNLSLLAETHSHHTMGAFFSGTDDANENATQFYGVWGKIKDREPQFAFRYVSGDAKVECCPSILFDWPMVTERTTVELTADVEGFEPQCFVDETKTLFKGPFPKIEYPSDWMGQHSKSYVAPAGGKGNYNWGKKNSQSKTGKRSLGGASRWNDYEAWEGDYYQDSLFNYGSVGSTPTLDYDSYRSTLGKGFDGARIKKMMNRVEDEVVIKEHSQYDIDVITANYKELGLDRVIEASIDAMKSVK